MQRWILLLVFTFSHFLFLKNTGAQSMEGQAALLRPLTLNEMVQLGLKQSARIKLKSANLLAAQSRTKAAIGALFPNIELKGAATSADDRDDNYYRAYAAATQPLYMGGALTSAYRLNKQKEEVEALSLMKEMQDYIYELVTGYYNYTRAFFILNTTKENLQILQRHLEIIVKYEKIGRARKSDLLLARVNVANAQAETNRQITQLLTEKEKLRSLLETEQPPEMQFDFPLTKVTFKKWNADDSVAYAFKNSYMLRLLELTREQVENEKNLALAEDMPSIYLTGEAGYRNDDRESLFHGESEYSSVTLNLSIPIFSGLSSMAKRREYEQRKTSASSDYAARKFELEASLRGALLELNDTQEQLRLAEQSATDSREALRLADREYTNSMISSQDVINIQRTRFDTQKNLLNAQHDYMINLLKVQNMMGVDLKGQYANE